MAKHKKQHFIPKCYLKAWCDPSCHPRQSPYVWVFEKEGRTGKRKSPGNIFTETDMYTIHHKNGDRNLTIEHGFSQIENIFATIRNKKFNYKKELSEEEHSLVCVFIAAMHVRTRKQLDHISEQWSRPLEIADDLAEKLKTATKEEKRSMVGTSSFSDSDKSKGFTHKQVREMVESPATTMMVPMIDAEAPLLEKLDFAILCTEHQKFITTDSPCVWFDAEAHKRPRSPALMYESIEITLPISPTQCVLLNRKGINGYVDADTSAVNEINRGLRYHAYESYIVHQNNIDEAWFEERD